ncbi:sigma-54 interaction domain-containing protein [Effusibacillus lacus]|nr:sigma 54-interacting transcriptional regulator [Effusibacillus lacus]TCS72268.1 PAS domain S-box-containing protein [Effusibacillus lacus]
MLHKVKAFLDVLLDSVNDAVTGVDPDGTVLYWNQVAERIYGIPKEQIVGKKIGEFFQKGSVMLFQVMETGCPVHQLYHKPRPDKHVFINAVPIYDQDGELIGAFAIEQDITHTVKLSEELYSKPELPNPSDSAQLLVNRNSSMQQIIQTLRANPDRHLLIGEPGVGKDTLALTAHRSVANSGPFVTVPCDTIPGGLLDSELFGFEKEAFGGEEGRSGKLEMATGGTLYLKNIHVLSLPTQAKLAQTLSEKNFLRVGGTTPIPLESRVIVSASPDIETLVQNGLFLKELYYAFQPVHVPSLNERKEDLPELCHHFLSEAAQLTGKTVPRLSSEVMAALTTYHWPGNLPQLRTVMEHLANISGGREITLEDLPPSIRPTTLSDLAADSLPLAALSEEMERSKIEDALRKTGGNKAGAARLLGISRGSLYYKMKQYRL